MKFLLLVTFAFLTQLALSGELAKAGNSSRIFFAKADKFIIVQNRDSSKCNAPGSLPEFPGGTSKFMDYIKINFKTPRNNGAEGSIIVTFIIEKNGSLSDIKIAKGLTEHLDKEILRVVSQSPKWHPGLQNCKPMRMAFSVPVQIPFSD